MERNKGKIKRSLIVINILFSLIIILLSYLTINNYFKYQKLTSENSKLISELDLVQKEYAGVEEKNRILVDTKNELNNFDEKELKKEIFDLASKLEERIISGDSKYKIAYLTFDDGPYYSTNKVLDILDEYKIKATFFTIGLDKDICFDNKAYSCADIYLKEVERGHTIANHTYNHAIFKGLYTSSSAFMDQVKKQEDLIKERTGVKTNIVRFPGGSGTANALLGKDGTNNIMQSLRENGYGWVDWTSQDGDGGYLPTYAAAWDNFINSINEDIEVVLFHDYSNITISMLPKAIEYLEENNYILLPLFYESVKVNK